MKHSTNLKFLIKILVLLCLIIVGFNQDSIFSAFDSDEEPFKPLNSEVNSLIYYVPLTTPVEASNLTSITSKK